MDGRPLMVVPVFMNVWAGSWLIASVFIDRITHSSSATSARCGKMVEISTPDLPHFLNSCCGPRQLSLAPWSWAIGWPLVIDSGIGWPVILASVGFGSSVSRWLGPPAMHSQMTRLIFGLKCGLIAPGHFSTLPSANSDGVNRLASAKVPRPPSDWPRNDRRLHRARRDSNEVIEVSGRRGRAHLPG